MLICFQLMDGNSIARADEERAIKLLETVALVSLTLHCDECRSIQKRSSYSNKVAFLCTKPP